MSLIYWFFWCGIFCYLKWENWVVQFLNWYFQYLFDHCCQPWCFCLLLPVDLTFEDVFSGHPLFKFLMLDICVINLSYIFWRRVTWCVQFCCWWENECRKTFIFWQSWIRLVPAQDVHFFYTRSHLNALQNCELLFSINFQLVFIFIKCITQFSHWMVSCAIFLSKILHRYLLNSRTVL